MLATALTANVSTVSNGQSLHPGDISITPGAPFDDDSKDYDPIDMKLGMAGITLGSICADAQHEIQLSRQMAYLQMNEAMRLLQQNHLQTLQYQQQHGPMISALQPHTYQCQQPQKEQQPPQKQQQCIKPQLRRTASSPAPWMTSPCDEKDDAESIITYVGGKMVRVPSIRSVSSYLFADTVDQRSRARNSGLKRARTTFEESPPISARNDSTHLLHPLSRLHLRGLSNGRSIRICDASTDKRTKRKMQKLMTRKKLARQRSMSCGAMLGAIKEHSEQSEHGEGLSGSF